MSETALKRLPVIDSLQGYNKDLLKELVPTSTFELTGLITYWTNRLQSAAEGETALIALEISRIEAILMKKVDLAESLLEIESNPLHEAVLAEQTKQINEVLPGDKEKGVNLKDFDKHGKRKSPAVEESTGEPKKMKDIRQECRTLLADNKYDEAMKLAESTLGKAYYVPAGDEQKPYAWKKPAIDKWFRDISEHIAEEQQGKETAAPKIQGPKLAHEQGIETQQDFDNWIIGQAKITTLKHLLTLPYIKEVDSNKTLQDSWCNRFESYMAIEEYVTTYYKSLEDTMDKRITHDTYNLDLARKTILGFKKTGFNIDVTVDNLGMLRKGDGYLNLEGENENGIKTTIVINNRDDLRKYVSELYSEWSRLTGESVEKKDAENKSSGDKVNSIVIDGIVKNGFKDDKSLETIMKWKGVKDFISRAKKADPVWDAENHIKVYYNKLERESKDQIHPVNEKGEPAATVTETAQGASTEQETVASEKKEDPSQKLMGKKKVEKEDTSSFNKKDEEGLITKFSEFFPKGRNLIKEGHSMEQLVEWGTKELLNRPLDGKQESVHKDPVKIKALVEGMFKNELADFTNGVEREDKIEKVENAFKATIKALDPKKFNLGWGVKLLKDEFLKVNLGFPLSELRDKVEQITEATRPAFLDKYLREHGRRRDITINTGEKLEFTEKVVKLTDPEVWKECLEFKTLDDLTNTLIKLREKHEWEKGLSTILQMNESNHFEKKMLADEVIEWYTSNILNEIEATTTLDKPTPTTIEDDLNKIKDATNYTSLKGAILEMLDKAENQSDREDLRPYVIKVLKKDASGKYARKIGKMKESKLHTYLNKLEQPEVDAETEIGKPKHDE